MPKFLLRVKHIHFVIGHDSCTGFNVIKSDIFFGSNQKLYLHLLKFLFQTCVQLCFSWSQCQDTAKDNITHKYYNDTTKASFPFVVLFFLPGTNETSRRSLESSSFTDDDDQMEKLNLKEWGNVQDLEDHNHVTGPTGQLKCFWSHWVPENGYVWSLLHFSPSLTV